MRLAAILLCFCVLAWPLEAHAQAESWDCTGEYCVPEKNPEECTGRDCLPKQNIEECTGKDCLPPEGNGVQVCEGEDCTPKPKSMDNP